MTLHRYTTSEYWNFKWFIKRLLLKETRLDKLISEFIRTNIDQGTIILNMGSGYWTPYDRYLRQKSKKVYNVDTSLLVKVFRFFNCKRIILDDKNIYEIINKFNIDTITSFHSISFIHINLPKLIKFCTERNIKFLFDWSVMNDLEQEENISKFCYGNSKYEIFKLIKTHNLHIEDTFNKKKVINKEQIYAGGRYLVKTCSICSENL